jgi:very-short-patch-repair endonuclease
MPNHKKTTAEWVSHLTANNPHFTYEKTVYHGWDKKSIVTCPIHGDRELHNRYLKDGGKCDICSRIEGNRKIARGKVTPLSVFIKKSRANHDIEYDYSKVKYNKLRDVVIIGCPIHGDFPQGAGKHMSGQNCPDCVNTQQYTGWNEKHHFQPFIMDIFPTAQLQHQFAPYVVDVYIPHMEIVIEYDENYHYRSKNRQKDRERQQFIEENYGVSFIRVSDDEFMTDKQAVVSQLYHLLG